MQRIAFKMKMFSGMTAEYKKRHDEIAPELVSLLKDSGISDYYIFLDEETNILFGTMNIKDQLLLENLPNQPIMKKWWHHMKDIMETNFDESPVSIPLKEVFYLP